jgi:hypothetical protein
MPDETHLFPCVNEVDNVLVWLTREMPEDVDFLKMSYSVNDRVD